MQNIILKSRKDLEWQQQKPKLNDIISIKGFARYFLYRNTLPGIRDLLFFIFDTTQIFLIYYFLGRTAFTGGLLGYIFSIFITSFWGVITYSMRAKALELNTKEGRALLPNYFAPLAFAGGIIWLIFTLSSAILINDLSTGSRIIFLSRLLSGGFELYASLYFLTVYTLSRIYIPFSITIINRLIFLILPILFVRQLGAWAFAIGFMLEKSCHLLITLKYCNRTLRIKGFQLVNNSFRHLMLKKTFWFLVQEPLLTIKRVFSFSIISLQKLIIILAVSKYYPAYLFNFFAFYQIINVFSLIPGRISKSLYYDMTNLLYKSKLYMLKKLFNYNIFTTIFLAFLAVLLFSFLRTLPVPIRFYDLIFELTIMDKWNTIYMLIFFTFGISIFNRFLLVSESHILMITLALFFDYIYLGWLIMTRPHIMETGDPIFIFSFQGEISLYYFIALLLVYVTGLWKKSSVIASIKHKIKSSSGISTLNDFAQKVNSAQQKEKYIAIAILLKKYSGDKALFDTVLDSINETIDVKALTRVSHDTIFILIDNDTMQEMDIVSSLGVYCSKVLIARPDDLMNKINSSFKYKDLDTNNSLTNMIEPKFVNYNNDIEDSMVKNTDSNIVVIKDYLDHHNVKYKVHSIDSFKRTTRNKEIGNLFSIIKLSHFLPANILLKKEYLGLIPIIDGGELLKVIEVQDPDFTMILKILRTLCVREFYNLVLRLKDH